MLVSQPVQGVGEQVNDPTAALSNARSTDCYHAAVAVCYHGRHVQRWTTEGVKLLCGHDPGPWQLELRSVHAICDHAKTPSAAWQEEEP